METVINYDNELLDLLITAANIINRNEHEPATVTELLKLVCEKTSLQKARVITKSENDVYYIKYAYGLSRTEMIRGIYEIGEGVTGRVLQQKQIALIPDVSKEPQFVAKLSDPLYQTGKTSYLAIPIVKGSEAIGVLAAQRVGAGNIPAQEIHILLVLATMIQQVLTVNELIKYKTTRLAQENTSLKEKLRVGGQQTKIIGESKAIKNAMFSAERASESNASVLVLGESGTGKELFARFIHEHSSRSYKPFVAVNCAAIPSNLIESELFGYEKGSFTGADKDRAGKFEMANGGSLFLDEIGELEHNAQAKLLRVLQEKKIQRIGSSKECDIDVRIIAATHQDLQARIRQGDFRLDLFYRLNIILINLPALRERQDDIINLCEVFLEQSNRRYKKHVKFSTEAKYLIKKFPWPGNIRQLENFIERLIVMHDGYETISHSQMQYALDSEGHELSSKPVVQNQFSTGFNVSSRPYVAVDAIAQSHILDAIKQCRGNKTQAALLLGLTPRQLQYRIKKLDIPV